MAQDLERIVELLRETTKTNSGNTNNFNNLLATITDKIETGNKNKEFTKVIKSYLADLAAELRGKYSFTLEQYTQIENILKTVFDDQTGHGKEIKKLYGNFTDNLEIFKTEIEKITAELLKTEAALTDSYNNQIEPALEALRQLQTLNFKFDNSLNEVVNDLEVIINKFIKPGRAKILKPDNEQISVILTSVSEILDNIKALDKNDTKLSQILENLEKNEKLKTTQGIIDSIFSKSEETLAKIKNFASKKSENKHNEQIEITQAPANIADVSDSLLNGITTVKKDLADISKNINGNPDIQALSSSLQDISAKVNLLSNEVENTEVSKETDKKISAIFEELTTVKNIVADLNDSLIIKINTIADKTELSENLKTDINNLTASMPKKEDIENLLKNYETKLESLISKTEDISEKLENLPTQESISSLSTQPDEIENMIDDLNFDEEFNNLYNKTNSIQNWLEKSNIKENSEEILSQLESKAEQNDVLKILETSEKIIDKLEKFSQTSEENNTQSTASNISEIIDELKNEFINTAGMHNSAVIEQLTELENCVNGIVTAEEFNTFVEDLKNFIEKINSENIEISDNIDEINSSQNTLLERLNLLDADAFKNIVTENSHKVEEKLTTISDYMSEILKSDNDELKKSIAEIKEVLENKKSNFDEIENNNKNTIQTIQEYLKNIKDILDTSDTGISADTQEKIDRLENALTQYQSDNRNSINQIIDKIDEYKNVLDNAALSNNDLTSSVSEILEIKDQIKQLGESFKTLNYEKNSEEDNISTFIAEKLVEISDNLSELTSGVEEKLQTGFAYNAELIEEKTSTLLDFIQELRHSNTQNPDLYEKLTVADSKLLDSKQELELINTDIISSLNAKTDQLIEELAPIKEMIASLANNSTKENSEQVKENLDDLHENVQEDLFENTKYSKSTYDKLEETYNKINADLSETENNLRDFILGDIDSVIIKVDNMKAYLEENLNRITPPDAEHMAEFKNFVEQINSFKSEQKELITEAAEDIKTTLSEQISSHHDEIKSMLTVAVNNAEIVSAIDNLKRCFKIKIKELIKLQKETAQSAQDNLLDFSSNQYERVFEDSKNAQVIEDIKADFDKFSDLIKDLSGDNPQIEEVLEAIKSKMETLSVAKAAPEIIEGDEDSDTDADSPIADNESFDFDQDDSETEEECNDLDEEENDDDDDDILVGVNNFDIIKALDLLKQDINNLHADIARVLPQETSEPKVGKTASPSINSLKSIPTLGNDNLLLSLNNKIDLLSKTINKNWLEEIKNYISGSEIHSMLEEISDKINILTLTDNSEWIMEIKQALDQLNNGGIETGGGIPNNLQATLALINEKIDILASSEDYDLMEEVREAIERLNSIQGTDSGNMLNLINEKIDIIASSDNIDDFEDIKDSLQSIESKIEEVSSAKDLEIIKDSISKLEERLLNNLPANYDETNDIRDILDSIEGKIDSVASSETSNNIEDIKYTLLNVDEKVDTVKQLSESDAKITSMLEELNHKIDTIAKDELSGTKSNIEDVKDLILAQTDYLESFEKNHKTDAVRKCLKELTVEVNNLNSNDSTKRIQQTLKDMKESIMAAVVTVFEQVSFVEESEDIKDFVEEKTDEINQSLTAVTKQLKQITSADEASDYNYSMQDIESDLAKLRLALNNLQTTEQETQANRLSFILDNINQIGSSVVDLQNSLSSEEAFGLKSRFDRINTDIKSLNALTHQLFVASGESYNAINSGIEEFGKVITDQLASKVDNVTKLLEKSNASDKVMRQALIYMGEWIDSASDSMNKISTNSEEIIDIKSAIEDLKKDIPEQTDILNSIEEKFDEQQERLAYFEKQISKLGGLEDKFEEQQERIDRLEMALEKILSAVEDIDDSKVTRKIDKIDKQIAKLSSNIEKLASYVD